MKSAKEPFVENDPDLVAEALAQVLDSRNYPLLVHSNKGKHRWCVSSIPHSLQTSSFHSLPFLFGYIALWG
jgi:Tyrosine phosphatase family